MATYHVYNAAAGAGTGADWTNAFTTFGAAVTAASSNGDVIKVHVAHTENLGADTTYTFAAHVAVICVDKDNSDALAVMGTSAWIGHNTLNFSIVFAGAVKVFMYGLTFRNASTGADFITLCNSDGSHQVLENCYLWLGTTSTTALIQVGVNDTQCFARLKDCTLRFGATAQSLSVRGNVVIEGGSVSADGSAPSSLFSFAGTDPGGATVRADGTDLSHISGNIVGDATSAAAVVTLTNCKLHASATWLAAQTVANKSGAEVFLFDCHSGDTHIAIGHEDGLGKTEIATGISFTGSEAGCSWKITTTAAASFYTPYRTPWIDTYHDGLAAITPYLEILRDGSSTAFNNDEVWGEFRAKVTSGSVVTTAYSDRKVLLASAAAQAAGAGTGSWSGENATAWSGKVDSGSALTPAEVGFIRSRFAVGAASATVYGDPRMRT